jgi:tRNA threonylcarbamoyl adenosine modification protein TsaD
MPAPEVETRARGAFGLEQIEERARVSCRGTREKACGPGSLRGPVAHAEGRQIRQACRPGGLGRMDGGQDKESRRHWQREGHGHDLEDRGDDDRDIGADPCAEGRGEVPRLRLGPGEEDRGQRRGHRSPARVVWPLRRCYLPDASRATGGPMPDTVTVLGLESSCDDTAAAVVRRAGGRAEILSSVVWGQAALHAGFGGVVPEIAARAHAEKMDLAVEAALAQAGVTLAGIDAIAVTAGPGLIGGVLSGVSCAKGIAAATGLPLLGVNHLAGHALTPRLTDGLAFPYLILLVSGGHCQFLIVRGADEFTRLGGTIDDAPGEAFDKAARLLGLPQPGGPEVEREAKAGDPTRFAFPRPLLDRPGCDLSFSGLKTALLRARDAVVAEKGGLTVQDRVGPRGLVPGRRGRRAVGKVAARASRGRTGDGLRRGGRRGGEQDASGRIGVCFTRNGCALRGPSSRALH